MLFAERDVRRVWFFFLSLPKTKNIFIGLVVCFVGNMPKCYIARFCERIKEYCASTQAKL